MADYVSVIKEICGCITWGYQKTKFIWCSRRNKRKLETDMNALREKRRELLLRQLGTIPTTSDQEEVEVVDQTSWLQMVTKKEKEVEELLQQGTGCCTCCFVAYKGKKMLGLIEDVNSLVEQRTEFDGYRTNLERSMKELKRMQEVVEKIIERQERQNPEKGCKDAVSRWLKEVCDTVREANASLHSVEETTSWVANVKDLIEDIGKLVEERNKFDNENLVEAIPRNPVHNIPDLSTDMVGRNLKLSEIHSYLKDSQVKTVGIFGAGGIGKTTLLKSIKDGLSKNRDIFFYIIWIELLSQNTVDILDIQKQIAECISVTLPPEQDKSERARTLRNVLQSEKSTLVLIDNLWNKLDFQQIGIPSPLKNDNVKIVLTARSRKVCTDMGAQKIVKLDYLNDEESLQLFQNKISSTIDLTNNLIVRQRVDKILKKCGGLTLAIVTIASTVKDYTDVAQWDDVVDCLQNSPAEMEGMDDVMMCLKFSYDKLESNEIRSCLLYFSLYPQGWDMRIDELIIKWIGEGFLDISNKNSFKKSYVKGIDFVNKLKSFCLVESGIADHRVKVHDVIREMLCWICKNERKEVFLVYDENHDVISNDYKDWNLAKGMYLNERQLIKCTLPEEGMPPNLTSVIVQANYSHRIVKLPTQDFFCFTPSLRVLDLSFIALEELPKSIGELGVLRHLNLFRTRIKMLPVELGNLKKLKFLDLGHTMELESIPDVAISQLSMLQFLNLHNSKYRWDSHIFNETKQLPLMLEDLRELINLEELGVDVLSNSHLNTILSSQILLKSIARIRFYNIEFTEEDLGQPIKLICESFRHLKELIVEQCALPGNILEIEEDQPVDVEELSLWNLDISSVVIAKDCTFHSLEGLRISNCPCLKEVSWTTQLPSLQWLTVEKCNGLEELVATGEEEEIEEERDSYFPKLLILQIQDMENLQSINGRRNRPLLFLKLERLHILNCPKLKGLSLGRDSAKGIKIILCEQHQWDSFEWEDHQVRARFLPYFRVRKISTLFSCSTTITS